MHLVGTDSWVQASERTDDVGYAIKQHRLTRGTMGTHDEPNNDAAITKGTPTANGSPATLEDIEAMAADGALETFLSEHAVPELDTESERRELSFASIEPFDRNTFDYAKHCGSLAAPEK